ncbi:MAG: hypothetical protein PHC92_10025 [Syntrophomonadaceae bacterium]|nr:hypothetical protein [Syntrophomonadaceae bacterium]MDD3022792.1 hypothetical protein [Syntrophomonadaceae bacterium]
MKLLLEKAVLLWNCHEIWQWFLQAIQVKDKTINELFKKPITIGIRARRLTTEDKIF